MIATAVALALDAAPWLVLGLAAAGLVHAWVPVGALGRWLGGRGWRPAVLAALIGAPVPLCSCAVLPAAVALRRGGASREAMASFLIATPETGLDSISLTYGMLGPFFALARPLAAMASAIATGMMMMLLPADRAPVAAPAPAGCGHSCGCSGPKAAPVAPLRRTVAGLCYAFTTLFDELAPWLAAGLLAAAVVATVLPPEALGRWGGGLPAMLAMIVLGIPMYICASASTPLAAALLLAGLSPGAVMVFLLAGPGTNLTTIAVVRRELGTAAGALYLGGLIACSLAAGCLTDLAAPFWFDASMLRHPVVAEDTAAGVAGLASLALLLGLSIRTAWLSWTATARAR